MNGIKNFLQMINENWTTIVVIISLIFTLCQKIKSFINLTREEKLKIAKSQIKDTILKLVSDAELDYSYLNKSGEIKRSQVISKIYEAYPILSKVYNKEKVVEWLDKTIDEAVVKITKHIEEKEIEETEIE